MKELLNYHPEAAETLATNKPIVALESTVITHGLPYPENIETAMKMETAVRKGGAVPATIAILQGKIQVGLTEAQLEYLGTRPSADVRKCSRRDLPVIMAQKEDGATTVAGTMILAHAAGIPIFATGGIGGVHRGHPFDVSADLSELGRTSVTVVCSGAKSILDLPATLEVLETQGVPVIGYRTDELPAFFTPHSGLPVNMRLDTPTAVAGVIKAQHSLNMQNGILVTVPTPKSAALDTAEMETAVAQATYEADELNIHGAAATPWLLSRIMELTGGRSLQANIALLRNNGYVAALIATELALSA